MEKREKNLLALAVTFMEKAEIFLKKTILKN